MSNAEPRQPGRSVAVIVAHPDDETIWAGGAILSHPQWQFYIATLCRMSDADRAPRFYRAVHGYGATGRMAGLDDGPGQTPLDPAEVEGTILHLLPALHFDLVITHSPFGEYTRHARHEECGRAVISLWQSQQLFTSELWMFAYEDNGKRHLPRAIENASIYEVLRPDVWRKKYRIITDTYGFPPDGFEAQTTPHAEAFWRFTDAEKAASWMTGVKAGS